MSSLFSHIFIPLAILFIFSGKLQLDPKVILALSFFGILPDADALIFLHRASFHNIFIVVIIPSLIYFLIRDIKISGMVSFYLLSHLILDIFNGGIFLLYPIYDVVFFSRIEIWFPDMIPIIYYGISDKIVPTGRGEPMISSENVGIAILLIIFIIASIMVSIMKKRL